MSNGAHSEPTVDSATALAVAVALTSVLALDPGGWFPFSIAKWPVVLVCALAAAACLAWTTWPRVERRWGLVWSLLIGAVVLSAVVGLEGRMAWFGTPVRHLGALTWIVFAMLFVVGAHIGSRGELFGSFAKGAVAAGGALGVYAMWELLIDAPVDYVSNSSRLGGPYGSAAYLGAACCLFLPVAIGLAASSGHDRRWRVGASLVAVLLAVATIGSGTRGALVALVLTGAVVMAAQSGSSTRRRVTPNGLGLGVIVLTAVVVAMRERFSRTAPVGSRLDEWRLGITALTDRPLLGFGPEGYRLVVDRHLSADYVRSYGDAVLPDRAHNAVLDVALSSGVIAAAAYLALLTGVALAAVRLLRHGTAMQGGVGAASIAFIVQQQFLFPIAEIDAVFWIVAGATVATMRRIDPGRPADVIASSSSSADGPLRACRRSVAAVLAVVALLAAVSGVRSVAADRLMRTSTRSADVEQSIADAERAVDLDPHDIRLQVVLARSFERRQTLNGVDAAIETIERARSISPLDPTVRREQARLASLRASITGTDVDRVRATMWWSDIVADAPNCGSCQRSLGLTLFEVGDIEGASEALERAAALGDDVAISMLDGALTE